jgi:branched-chain amino acid transport system ATP-binding protein
MSNPLLAVNDVTVKFGGIVALNGVSFDITAGQICALIGPNGAGKSTLFNCLSRLYDYSNGSIVFNGVDLQTVQRYSMSKLGIGRTFQNLALFKSMTVRDNILVGCHSGHETGFLKNMFRLPGPNHIAVDANKNADSLIDYLDLGSVSNTVVADLPFGTQKRVELARALASKPKLLLLDEPACGLNHEELEGLGKLICDIRDNLKISVLLVEHHMGLVMGISDHVVALNFGKKIAEGTPDVVRKHPEVISAYLGVDEGATP